MKGKRQAGFTLVEMMIASVITLGLLYFAVDIQKSTVNSFRVNEVASQPLDEISRVGERLDRELRAASAGTLEVPGSPFPTAPASGTPYQTLTYRRVLYDPIGGATYSDATLHTLNLNGTNLELTVGGTTTVIARDVTNFSLVWDGALKCLATTLQVRKTPPFGGNPITKTVTKSILLRNV